jgi:hypothetical protein
MYKHAHMQTQQNHPLRQKIVLYNVITMIIKLKASKQKEINLN